MVLNSVMADSIGHEIKSINHILQRKMLALANEEGLDKVTVMHGWIMCFLADNKDRDIYQKDIESTFSISRSTVTNILKLMEEKGYINRVSVDCDARLKKLILTQKGEEINKVIHTTILSNEEKFDKILTDEEKKTFLYLIRKLKKGLENS